MSTLDYNTQEVRQGIERLKLLGKHSEMLVQNYHGAQIDELQVGARVLNQLIELIFYAALMKIRV